jgi:REP element-mobilizing transposase RayT
MIDGLEIMHDHIQLFVRTGPDASPALIAHQCKCFTSQSTAGRVSASALAAADAALQFVHGRLVGGPSEGMVGRSIAERAIWPERGGP